MPSFATMHPTFFFLIFFCSLISLVANSVESHVYLALLKDPPIVHKFDGPTSVHNSPSQFAKDETYMPGQSPADYGLHLIQTHNSLLQRIFARGTYQKLYSYNHILNGFAVLISEEQAAILSRAPEVLVLEKDYGVKKLTTYTPTYLGLPAGAWKELGGVEKSGEGIVIGVVDTGINPAHPSFSNDPSDPLDVSLLSRFTGSCEVADEFPKGSCNTKLVSAQHFAAAAVASGQFDASIEFASPLDADGHGTHTASTAAGNTGIPVVVDGLNFGVASGIAPRASIAVYKAIYQGLGGFIADVVAAIEQAVKDNVDILSLSIGPGGPPAGIATFFNIFDIGMLSAAKAGVFVAQAAGNTGPFRQSILSFSPWICTVAAAVHDRTYTNSMMLGSSNWPILKGVGLAPGTPGYGMYPLVLASDALESGSSTISSADNCQNSSLFQKSLVRGRILVCTFDGSFIVGACSTNNVVDTVRNLSAEGVVMVIPIELDGQLKNAEPVPFPIPAIILDTYSASSALLKYYHDASKFTATIRIFGGTFPEFSHQAPRVADYSSRGPDLLNSGQQLADLLKPNVMAPGSMIWAAWSPIGKDSPSFQGQNFAMISGTSMATPHIAGIAALVKQKHPKLSPAAIASAIATTAFVVDKNGHPLLAEYPSANVSVLLGPASPFDFGGGAVNPTAALDPGLVFDAGFDDYVKFLCAIPGAATKVKNTTGATCGASPGLASDLNMPSITVASLTNDRYVPRRVTNIGSESETYTVKITEPKGVAVKVKPMEFTIDAEETKDLMVMLDATENYGIPSFGSILLSGSKGHEVRVPISVASITKSAASTRYFDSVSSD